MPEDLLSGDKVRGMNMNDAEDRLLADVIKQRELDANYIPEQALHDVHRICDRCLHRLPLAGSAETA